MKLNLSVIFAVMLIILCSCGSTNTSNQTSTDEIIHRFTVNQDGTVADRDTALVWQQSFNENLNTYAESEQYCNSLDLGNYTDWRVPSINELLSTSDSLLVFPSQNDGFIPITNVSTHGYRSSTPYVGDELNMWYLGKQQWFRTSYYNINSQDLATRCVRGSGKISKNQFKDNLNGTITDISTSLMWKQHQYRETNSEVEDLNVREWANSASYCENLTFAGYDDWRLPHIKELLTIIDYSQNSPAIDQLFFLNVSSCCSDYWSSTTLSDDSLSVWTVHIADHGYITSQQKNNYYNYSICMRNIN